MNPFEVCTLGNINVSHFVNAKGQVNTKELIQATNTSISFLNDVIDRLALPLEQMRTVSKKHRRIGLGIMGFADALRNANVAYGSPKSFTIAHDLANVMKQTARVKKSEFNNASVLALAPTGGTAMLVNASYSLEPYFQEALSISVENQIKMVETWQKKVDNAISKTINLSKYSTFEEAAHVFDLAYKHNLRGITIYKDGSRDFQPIACSVC
jgi:ribonucleoside-diphosphate reductase alpha chain